MTTTEAREVRDRRVGAEGLLEPRYVVNATKITRDAWLAEAARLGRQIEAAEARLSGLRDALAIVVARARRAQPAPATFGELGKAAGLTSSRTFQIHREGRRLLGIGEDDSDA